MIYFIDPSPNYPEDFAEIKIVATNNVWAVMGRLKAKHARSLIQPVIIHQIGGERYRESLIHNLLKEHKTGRNTFRREPVLKFIEGLKNPPFRMDGDRPAAVLFYKKGKQWGGDVAITDPCPFCSSNHVHGFMDGYRVPHCPTDKWGGDIEVTLPNGLVLLQKRDYYLEYKGEKDENPTDRPR